MSKINVRSIFTCFVILTLSCFIIHPCNAQQSRHNEISLDASNPMPQMMSSIVLLYTKVNSGYVTGTGFLVSDTIKDGFVFDFLVTAHHVAAEMNTSTKIIFHGVSNGQNTLRFDDISGGEKWTSNNKEDLAVHCLYFPPLFASSEAQALFMSSSLIMQDMRAPSRQTQLTMLGFPLGSDYYGGNILNAQLQPFTFHTYASSDIITLRIPPSYHVKTLFLTENPVTAGYSGGPCIDLSVYYSGPRVTTSGNGLKVYGVAIGTIPDDSGGKLGEIVPSKYVMDLVHRAEVIN